MERPMGPASDDVAPSPGGESVVSSKRGASPDGIGGGGGSAAEAAAKRKKTGPGSRGVANLTPEQLAKKRENDREAQRNIRRRTKEQIEGLERQIQELTSQQPYQEFLAMKRAKEAAEKENAELKQRLAAIIGELQGLVGPDNGRAYVSPTQSYYSGPNAAPPPPLSANNASTPGSVASPGSIEQPAMQGWHSMAASNGSNGGAHGEHAKVQLNQQRHEMRTGLEMGPERLGLGFLLDPSHRVSKIQNGVNGAQDTARYQHTPMKHDWTDIRNDQALRARRGSSTTPNPPMHGWESPSRPGSQTPGLSQQQRDGKVGYNSGPLASPQFSRDTCGGQWSIPIKNCEPTCPLDSLLLDFLGERRQRAAEGLSAQEVVGPRYPSVSSLLNPAHSAYSHPLSKVFTDILSTFPDISNLPERVAVLYIMFLIMRWQISPTQENYERLPEWVRPRNSQLYNSHPAWIDHLPWPVMRDKLAREYNSTLYLFDNFFVPFTRTLRLNWPYEDTDTLLQSPDTEELMINPVFERHIRNLDNWTLGEPFAQAFPSLRDTCKIDPSTTGPKSRQ